MGKYLRFLWLLWITWPILFSRSEITPKEAGVDTGSPSNIHGSNDPNLRSWSKGSKEDLADACANSRGSCTGANCSPGTTAPAAPSAGGGW